MKQEIEHIVFDLGGVLVNIDLSRITRGFEEMMHKNDEAALRIRNQTIPAYETGKISTDEFLNELSNYLKEGFSREHIAKVWNNIFLDFPKERLIMLMELQKKYKVHLLSNINDLHAREFENHFLQWHNEDLRKYFHHFFYSHIIGKRKPDVETFEWVSKEIGTSPNKVLFIDDLEENIMGARNAGMIAEHLKLHEHDVVVLMRKLGYID